MRIKKKEMVKCLIETVIQNAECECDDGKSCALCYALILIDQHAEWEWHYSGELIKKESEE